MMDNLFEQWVGENCSPKDIIKADVERIVAVAVEEAVKKFADDNLVYGRHEDAYYVDDFMQSWRKENGGGK
jgi:hypothetical protein